MTRLSNASLRDLHFILVVLHLCKTGPVVPKLQITDIECISTWLHVTRKFPFGLPHGMRGDNIFSHARPLMVKGVTVNMQVLFPTVVLVIITNHCHSPPWISDIFVTVWVKQVHLVL